MEKKFHVKCSFYILNLVELLDKIREIVKFVKVSQSKETHVSKLYGNN